MPKNVSSHIRADFRISRRFARFSPRRAAIAFFLTISATCLAQRPAMAPWSPGVPRFTVISHGNVWRAIGESLAGANVPLWSSSFTYQGTNYPYVMVGTDPSAGSQTSRIPVIIIPLQFLFSDHSVFSAATPVCGHTLSSVALAATSPLLTNFVFNPGGTNVGTTQYVDAFQRANFWTYVSTVSPDYHVLLTPLSVLARQLITVSPANGSTVTGPWCFGRIGEMDINTFDSLAQSLLASLRIPSTSIPIFLSYNVFWTSGGQCCILGYHGSTASNQTYIVAAFSDPGIFNVPIEDVHALSHEIGEWMDDPFGNNIVPAWGNVGQVVGCQNNLEVGDPVTGIAFIEHKNGYTYHPEDLVFFSWFARQNPSIAVNGWYTFLNTFNSPQPLCQ